MMVIETLISFAMARTAIVTIIVLHSRFSSCQSRCSSTTLFQHISLVTVHAHTHVQVIVSINLPSKA